MFIIERRRVVRKYSYDPNNPYVWDRTFYVCTSQRIVGNNPTRVTLGYFKNAESLAKAIEYAAAELEKLLGTGRKTYIDYFGMSAWLSRKEIIEREIANLTKWQTILPDWNSEPLGEVSYADWPKIKLRNPRKSIKVKKAYDLWIKMSKDEQDEFLAKTGISYSIRHNL